MTVSEVKSADHQQQQQQQQKPSMADDRLELCKQCASDSDTENFAAPDQQLVAKIVAQIESYFADENLIKDEFLVKHIRRNRDGYVSLKLIASLRKVKVLTKDWRVVAHSVRNGSKQLELNENSTKIRRTRALPDLNGSKWSRTVIAYNLAVGNDTVDHIRETFSGFGEIALIRLFKAGNNGAIVGMLTHVKFVDPNASLASVEFTDRAFAEKATKTLETSNWRDSMRVVILFRSQLNDRPANSYVNRYRNSDANGYSYRDDRQQTQSTGRPLYGRQKSHSYSAGDANANQLISSPLNVIHANANSCRAPQPVHVIRHPFGPDGTNGFQCTRQSRSNSQP